MSDDVTTCPVPKKVYANKTYPCGRPVQPGSDKCQRHANPPRVGPGKGALIREWWANEQERAAGLVSPEVSRQPLDEFDK